MRKRIAVLLIFTIIILTPLQTLASTQKLTADRSIIHEGDVYEVTLIEKGSGYEKIKLENKKTGYLGYVESHFSDLENPKYKVITPKDNYIVKGDNVKEEVSIENLSTGEIEKNKSISFSIGQNLNQKILKSKTPNSTGSWRYMKHLSGKSSRREVITDIGLLASVLAAPFGGQASLFISVASWFIAKNIKNIYYNLKVYQRIKDRKWLWQKETILYYSNSSYNRLVDVVNTNPRRRYRVQ